MIKKLMEKPWITNIIPLTALIIMVIVFSFTTNGLYLSPANLRGLLEQTIPLLMGAMGMIFVISQGSIDMSFGSNLGVCSIFSLIISLSYGEWLFFPISLAVGAGVGLLNGVIISKFKVSSFMVTIAMLITLRALVLAMLTSENKYIVTPAIRAYNGISVKMVVTIILVIVIFYLFEKSKLGRVSRAVGENESAVRASGLNVDRYKIIVFAISGLFAGLCGAFMIARGGGAMSNLGNMQELRIFMTMFIGGIPITGGMGARFYKIVVGAALIAMLENGLSLSGATGPYYELIEGLLLIGIIALTLYMYNRSVHARSVTIT